MTRTALRARLDTALKGVKCGNGYIARDKQCGGKKGQTVNPDVRSRLFAGIGNALAKKFAEGDRSYLNVPLKGGGGNALELYARQGKKWINGRSTPITRVANIQFHEKFRGKKLGEGLLDHLGDRFPDHAVYVESVQPRWKAHLLKNGFIQDPDEPESVYKPPKNQRKDSLMYTEIEGYVRFDTLGEVPYDDLGYMRFDACTPGKTVPCGNACRAPQNCKKGANKKVGEKGQALRQNFADKVRASRGLQNRAVVNAEKSLADQMFGKSKSKTKGMGTKATAASRSASAKAGVAKRQSNPTAKSVLSNKSSNRFGEASAAEADLVESYMKGGSKKKKSTRRPRVSKAEQRQFGTATAAEANLVDRYMKKRGA